MASSLFGTDGIRGRVGIVPFTHAHLIQLGTAIGTWIINTYGDDAQVVIAQDTRESASFMHATLQSSMLLFPLHIHDAHIITTPMLCALLKNDPTIDCGIMISASHNPYYDNGIKIIGKNGHKLSTSQELVITDLYNQNNKSEAYTQFGTRSNLTNAVYKYIEYLSQFFPSQFLSGTNIALDCAHGATHAIAPAVFSHFGANVILHNAQPNGRNINNQCGSTYPSYIQEAAMNSRAHIGFAFDGDGDRVIVINHKGEICTGDDIIAHLMHNDCYKNTSTVVGTIMTNYGLEEYLTKQNCSLIRTNVGDREVGHALTIHNLIIGGETSGHIILRDYLDTGDGIFTALRIAQTALTINNWDIRHFNAYPQYILNLPVLHKPLLHEEPYQTLITKYQKSFTDGRIIIRNSGTESIVRIMVEASTEQLAHTVAQEIAYEVNSIVQSTITPSDYA